MYTYPWSSIPRTVASYQYVMLPMLPTEHYSLPTHKHDVMVQHTLCIFILSCASHLWIQCWQFSDSSHWLFGRPMTTIPTTVATQRYVKFSMLTTQHYRIKYVQSLEMARMTAFSKLFYVGKSHNGKFNAASLTQAPSLFGKYFLFLGEQPI